MAWPTPQVVQAPTPGFTQTGPRPGGLSDGTLAGAPLAGTPGYVPGPPTGVTSGGNPTSSVDPHGPAQSQPTFTPDAIQTDAFNQISVYLKNVGLPSSLTNFIWTEVQGGRTPDQIYLDLQGTQEYKDRFSGNEALKASGATPLSEAEYLAYERGAQALFKGYGLDAFNDQAYIGKLIGSQLSLSEVQSRVVNDFAKVADTSPAVRAAFEQFFGTKGDAALASYFLDPDHSQTYLERQVNEAVIAGAGITRGATVGEGLAGRLADAGVTESQAGAGFDRLAQLDPLFHQTVGEQISGGGVSQAQGIEATFGLGSQQEVARALESRVATDKGNARSQETDKGIVGLGIADT